MKASDFLRTLADVVDALDNKSNSNNITHDAKDLDQNPVWLPPQTQELELAKAALGKRSPVISKIIAPDAIGKE